MILLCSALVKLVHENYKRKVYKESYNLRRERGIKAGHEIIEESSERLGMPTSEKSWWQ